MLTEHPNLFAHKRIKVFKFRTSLVTNVDMKNIKKFAIQLKAKEFILNLTK